MWRAGGDQVFHFARRAGSSSIHSQASHGLITLIGAFSSLLTTELPTPNRSHTLNFRNSATGSDPTGAA